MRLAVLLAVAVAAAPAAAAERVALVIGNGAYRTMAPLDNPTRDAGAVAALLRDNGFTVVERRDLSRSDFLDALDEFRTLSAGADLAFVYYAGHGMDLGGRDVVAPVDMEVSCEGVLPAQAGAVRRAVALDELVQSASGAQSRVVLLDSCRSDPFPMCADRGAGASGFRGLARIGGSRPTLIVNATIAGEVAADGPPGGHSPFAEALLGRMRESPTVPFRDLFDQVAEDVRVKTAGAQIPEVTSRGGSPRACLAGENCDGGLVASARLIALAPRPAAPPSRPIGSRFRDRADGPEMVVLPAGRFLLGSPEGEEGQDAGERPQVRVSIARPFAIGRTEVTYDEYEACVLDGACPAPARDTGWGRGRLPVVHVDARSAEAYAAWLSATTGARYRLPSEAEWEYAARAGTTTAFSTGAALAPEAANVDHATGAALTRVAATAGRPVEVGSFPPNPFGLHDMHGNVAEWVADCWSADHAGAPTDGTARGGDCARRVVKGGSWYYEPAMARSAARASHPADRGLSVVGFRVVRDLE